MATYWGHLYKPQNRKTQDTQITNLNTISHLLIILTKSLTKVSKELWPAPHRCPPVVFTTFYSFRSSIKKLIRRTTVLILYIISCRVFHPRGYTSDDRADFTHHQRIYEILYLEFLLCVGNVFRFGLIF